MTHADPLPGVRATRHAAFLRGINIGGRRVTGTQLCAPFEALGFEDVASFLASGNVTFSARDSAGLEARIEAALEVSLGFEVDVFVRTAAEVAAVARFEPFPPDVVAATAGRLQVTFLRVEPNQADIAAALAHSSPQDRLMVVGREWYWLPMAGISSSSLNVAAIERFLGRGTTRTFNTVARLQARMQGDP